MSSGAATKAYAAWGSYGSGKAVYNSVSSHIAVEEPDIISVAIAPGRVDTEMQGVLRSEGKDTMDKSQYDTFTEAFEKGTLLKPEQPGHVMAKFVANPLRELTGKAFSYVHNTHKNFIRLTNFIDGTHLRSPCIRHKRSGRIGFP